MLYLDLRSSSLLTYKILKDIVDMDDGIIKAGYTLEKLYAYLWTIDFKI